MIQMSSYDRSPNLMCGICFSTVRSCLDTMTLLKKNTENWWQNSLALLHNIQIINISKKVTDNQNKMSYLTRNHFKMNNISWLHPLKKKKYISWLHNADNNELYVHHDKENKKNVIRREDQADNYCNWKSTEFN